MTKAITCVAALAIAAGCVGCGGSDPADWSRTDLTLGERDLLVETSKNASFVQIAPVLCRALRDNSPPLLFSPSERPWRDRDLGPSGAMYLMALEVWQHHVWTPSDPEKAAALLSLLETSTDDAEKARLITALGEAHWTPEAERPLLRLARDEAESLAVRRAAVKGLLRQCDLNAYVPSAVDIIAAHPSGMQRREAFADVTDLGQRLEALYEMNRNAIASLGFEMLLDLPDDQLDQGYFVARRLGEIIQAPNEFAPGRPEPAFRYEDGDLAYPFFAETTANALAWYRARQADMRIDEAP
ncbi:MAG: HEAT repeat domain-containing protein [Planctomycetota bacterium]|jgi:hypothetical protein